MRVVVLITILAFAAVTDASRVNVMGLRSILSYDKEPKYCKDYRGHSDCPEYYECVALKEKFCKSEKDCTKDGYGKDTCKYHEVCWDYHCVEKPRYCDPWAKYDECEKEYGYDWKCEKLDKPVCTYKDKCTPYKTDKCIEYDYEDKCHYVKDGCKEYAQKKECKYRDVCVKYKHEKKCEDKRECKEYKEYKHCVDKCADYDYSGKCIKYGKECTTKHGECKEYEYKKVNCKYVPTKYCEKYEKEEHSCHYVDTHCKEYKEVKKCEKVHKGCKKYEYKDRCEKVEDVCWKGKCIKKPPPPPKYHSPSPPKYHSPSHSTYSNGYGDDHDR